MELVTFQRNDLPALQADKPPRAARPQFSDIAVLRACAIHCRNFDHGVLLCETVESPINRRLSNVNSFGFETVHTLFRCHKPVAVFFQTIPDQLLLLRSVSDTFCHFSLISAHAFCACRVCVKCAQTQIPRLKNFIFQSSFPMNRSGLF